MNNSQDARKAFQNARRKKLRKAVGRVVNREDALTQRGALVEACREFVNDLNPDIEVGKCAYLTAAVILMGRLQGLDLIPQAGNAAWPRLKPEQDDGVSDVTHFGYIMEGEMPPPPEMPAEFHMWAADPGTYEIIDLSLRDFPAECKRITGLDWLGDIPPDYLWQSQVPDNVMYQPLKEASERAALAVGRIWAEWGFEMGNRQHAEKGS